MGRPWWLVVRLAAAQPQKLRRIELCHQPQLRPRPREKYEKQRISVWYKRH